jgi:hypothetical protein
MVDLTPDERQFLTSPYQSFWGVHVSSVCHRPELWSLIKKGLIVLEDQQRVPAKNKPSFFLVLTEAGKAAWREINDHNEIHQGGGKLGSHEH